MKMDSKLVFLRFFLSVSLGLKSPPALNCSFPDSSPESFIALLTDALVSTWFSRNLGAKKIRTQRKRYPWVDSRTKKVQLLRRLANGTLSSASNPTVWHLMHLVSSNSSGFNFTSICLFSTIYSSEVVRLAWSPIFFCWIQCTIQYSCRFSMLLY